MWREMKADRRHEVQVEGGKVVAYEFGASDEVLFLLNGGPGLPCDYLRDAHQPLVDAGFRIVTHDQLGTGASDHPDDPALWTVARYVEEVEAVLAAMDLPRVHFLGHSWGGWCGIDYALKYPARIASMILTDTCADIPHLLTEIDRLRDALGPETVAMMQRFEAEGRYDHPACAAAVELLDCSHIRRYRARPAPGQRSRDGFNYPIFLSVQGPNEYHYTGSIRTMRRLGDISRFNWPTLILQGLHDALTPACGMAMQQAIPGARIHIFPNASHSPFYEEPEAYRATLLAFLDAQRGRARCIATASFSPGHCSSCPCSSGSASSPSSWSG